MARTDEDEQSEVNNDFLYEDYTPPPPRPQQQQPVPFPPPNPRPQPPPPQQQQPVPFPPPNPQPQPPLQQQSQAAVGDGWKSDLFDCMDDPENACATSGFIYGLAIFIACPCIISWSMRAKLRSHYGLSESPAPDWVTHCFCEWCALCQEYRELAARGLDPAIGWQGNVTKQQNIQKQQQATMAPPMNQTMM